MAMKRIAAMLLTLVLLLSCVGCAQDGRKEPGAEKADLGLTADVKPATDFTAKATVTQVVKVEGSAELLTLMMENMNQFPITGANPFNIIEP